MWDIPLWWGYTRTDYKAHELKSDCLLWSCCEFDSQGWLFDSHGWLFDNSVLNVLNLGYFLMVYLLQEIFHTNVWVYVFFHLPAI